MKHSFSVKKSKAFTIIELLVVVSIISMLSSIVLVSVQNARDKGRIGGGIRFATNNFRGFGDKMTVYYDFNETSGAPVDKSGNNTITSLGCQGTGCSSPSRISNSYSTSVGNAINFPKPTNLFSYIRTNSPNFITMPTSAAVSVWIRALPDSNQNLIVSDGTTVSSFSISLIASGASSNANEVQISDKLSNSTILTINSGVVIADGNWHNITWSSAVGGPENLYIDGKLVDSKAISGTTRAARNIYWIGFLNSPSVLGFGGNMDDFMMFQQALAQDEVQQIYAQGRLTHPLADAK